MNQFTTSRALERLDTLLRQDGISARTDHDGALLVFLHTDRVSVSVQGTRFRIEHVDGDGETKRCILLVLGRIDDAARLVAAYETPRPGSAA
ncbi:MULTISPECIES: hypothetical protein [Nocardiopsis]|uniref:Uncharacterized protein n=1 Tax=Nocardiopsis sinuspersici TaxID=501010 RepID=A0A1V3C2B9_9ACTN|nr:MULTISPECIES: hypothetical protein [Nocardiopsis]NYH50685.1 hypothetical protein [Nocardiopsis sinuspersici]OOC54540.1 hypothetical protein NOSIN_12575 [Nocardiopsis sinuspersici]